MILKELGGVNTQAHGAGHRFGRQSRKAARRGGVGSVRPASLVLLREAFDTPSATIRSRGNRPGKMPRVAVCGEVLSTCRLTALPLSDEITASFRRFGHLFVDWPHKAESKSYFPPKGERVRAW